MKDVLEVTIDLTKITIDDLVAIDGFGKGAPDFVWLRGFIAKLLDISEEEAGSLSVIEMNAALNAVERALAEAKAGNPPTDSDS